LASFFDPPSRRDYRYHEELVSYREIAERLPDVLSAWESLFGTMRIVLDAYFATHYASEMFLEHRFLSLVQAAESYHRRRFGGTYQDRETYTSGVYQSLIAAIPPDLEAGFKESLRNRLKYHFEWSLRRRISDLLNKMPPNSELQVPAWFSRVVSASRNDLTHLSDDFDAKTTSDQLGILADGLEVILKTHLLKDLGISLGGATSALQRRARRLSAAYEHVAPQP
jgi:hypothetical protein